MGRLARGWEGLPMIGWLCRRMSIGKQVFRIVGLPRKAKTHVSFGGYWQRDIAAERYVYKRLSTNSVEL